MAGRCRINWFFFCAVLQKCFAGVLQKDFNERNFTPTPVKEIGVNATQAITYFR